MRTPVDLLLIFESLERDSTDCAHSDVRIRQISFGIDEYLDVPDLIHREVDRFLRSTLVFEPASGERERDRQHRTGRNADPSLRTIQQASKEGGSLRLRCGFFESFIHKTRTRLNRRQLPQHF